MFTKKEIENISQFCGTLVNDLILGKLYTLEKENGKYPIYILLIKDLSKNEHVLKLNYKLYKTAKIRWYKNIEDQPEKSWFVDKILEELKK